MGKINEKELHQLFQKLKEGDKTAYEELYQQYSSLVYKIAFSILKKQENAEDIMQNVFMKIGNLAKERLPSHYEASWLYSVTKNEAISHLRKNKDMLPMEEIEGKEKEDELEKIIQKNTYQNMLSSLEQKEKQIISLKVEVGLSFKEIAKILKMPIGTVQWKYYKSLHSLKLFLGNLSLFVVSATLSMINLGKKQEKNTKQEQNNAKEEQKTKNTTITDAIEAQKEETLMQSTLEPQNVVQQEQTQQETIIEDTSHSFTWVDIGLFSFTTIFFVMTIFFAILFIKCRIRDVFQRDIS